MKILNNGKIFLYAFLMLFCVVSCSKEEGDEEVVYHQNYVKGKLDDTEVLMDETNATISHVNSDYTFIVRDSDEHASMFDWKVKLIDTPDSVVTLFLHLDRLSRTNSMIASPNNDPTSVQTKDQCYITVENTKTLNTITYTPTEHSQISAVWDYFIVTPDYKQEKHNGVTWDYPGRVWPGITGSLQGIFTNSTKSSKTMKLDIKFKLY